MSRFLVRTFGAALLLCFATAMAYGGVPDPLESFGPDRIGVSPANIQVIAASPAQAYSYTFTLRDSGGSPVAGYPAALAQLDFTACAVTPTCRPANLIPANTPSNASGEITWDVNLTFGPADPCPVDVLISGAVFHTIPGYSATSPPGNCAGNPGGDPSFGGVRSPDETGTPTETCILNLPDAVKFQQAFICPPTGPGIENPWRCDTNNSFDDICNLPDAVTFNTHFQNAP